MGNTASDSIKGLFVACSGSVISERINMQLKRNFMLAQRLRIHKTVNNRHAVVFRSVPEKRGWSAVLNMALAGKIICFLRSKAFFAEQILKAVDMTADKADYRVAKHRGVYVFAFGKNFSDFLAVKHC